MSKLISFRLFLLLLLLFSLSASAKYTDEVVQVTRVIDGDTIEVIYQEEIESVRLYGIDCPERGEPGFDKAKKYTEDVIAACHNRVLLTFPHGLEKKRDNFGRLLAIIVVKLDYHDSADPSQTMTLTDVLNVRLVDSKNAVLTAGMTIGKISNDLTESIISLKTNVESNPVTYEDSVKFFSELTKPKLENMISNGFNVNCSVDNTANSFSFFSFMLLFNNKRDVIETLIKNGVNINRRGLGRSTPLHDAARKNSNSGIIELLIKNGASVDSKNNSGDTPLHTAVLCNPDIGITRSFINMNSNVNAKNSGGMTPLHYAAYSDNFVASIEKLNLLLNAGADINAIDDGGQTALDYARRNNNSKAVTLLINAGADTSIREELLPAGINERYRKAQEAFRKKIALQN